MAGVDILIRRLVIGFKKGRRRHDLTGLAVAALGDLVLDPGGLHGVQRIGRAQPLDGCHLILHSPDRQLAGTNGNPVHMHRARAALGNAAAIFRSGYSKLVPQDPKKRHVLLDIHLMFLTVHGKFHGVISFTDGCGTDYSLPIGHNETA